MNRPKDIIPLNDEGQKHGYTKLYHDSGQLAWNGVWVNGSRYGCHEYYNLEGYSGLSGYFMNGNRVSINNENGYCFIWDKVELL